jgi:hypothetical protein
MKSLLVVAVLAFGVALTSDAVAQNPCNPCAKKAQNPCNPCGGKMKADGQMDADAKSYKSWTALTKPERSKGHGGKFVVTYANSAAVNTLRAEEFPFASGAKFIKEGYDNDGGKPGSLTTLYIMEKKGKEWLYAVSNPKGAISMQGMGDQAAMCMDCHAEVEKTDFVFTTKLP